MARTRIYFIGIRAFTIKDERVILETMGKEVVDMPLNCRENLVLSTAPVRMLLERPRKVADDDGDDSVESLPRRFGTHCFKMIYRRFDAFVRFLFLDPLICSSARLSLLILPKMESDALLYEIDMLFLY